MEEDNVPEAGESPEGAAVFPLIPPELGVNPLLLGALHAFVFLEGSEDNILDSDAAIETMEYMASYFQRLTGKDLMRVREDLDTLAGYAKEQKWPRQQVVFLKTFLEDIGVTGETN